MIGLDSKILAIYFFTLVLFYTLWEVLKAQLRDVDSEIVGSCQLVS